MVRILLASALVLSAASDAAADQNSSLAVDISNRGCIVDITPRSIRGPVALDANLALWVSPIDSVGPIMKLEVIEDRRGGLVHSVDICGYAAIRAGSFGITAVFEPGGEYHGLNALRGTAVITIPEGNFTIPKLELAEPQPTHKCLDEHEPEVESRRSWLLPASGGLLALLALFVLARRRADTYIV